MREVLRQQYVYRESVRRYGEIARKNVATFVGGTVNGDDVETSVHFVVGKVAELCNLKPDGNAIIRLAPDRLMTKLGGMGGGNNIATLFEVISSPETRKWKLAPPWSAGLVLPE